MRTSPGVFIQEYLGDLQEAKDMIDTVTIGYMDSRQSVIALMDYDEDISKQPGFFTQTVVLYTDMFGVRRMRIFNGYNKITSEHAEIFKRADLDVILNTILRQIIRKGKFDNSVGLNMELIDRVTTCLTSYRKYCSTTAKPSVLLLPETLKLLPTFMLGAMKVPAFMPFHHLHTISKTYGVTGIMSDLKFASIFQLNSTTSGKLLRQFYYNCYDVTDHLMGDVSVTEENYTSDEYRVRLADKNFREDRVYFIDTGKAFKVLVGENVDETVKTLLFGGNIDLTSGGDLTSLLYANLLSNGENYMAKLVYWLIGFSFLPMLSVEVVTFKMADLAPYMLEDKTVSGVSYFDMLVYCHKKIQQKLSA